MDHGILSPSGHVSKRFERFKKEELRQELFGDGLAFPSHTQPTQKETDLKRASELKELAGRGMKPRAYLKEAQRLELKWK